MNKDIEELIEQAKSLQENMQKIQQKLEKTSVQGEAGAGIVKVVVTCKYETLSVTIDWKRLFIEEGFFKALQEKKEEPQGMPIVVQRLMEKPMDMINTLVAAAFNDAARKIEAIVQREVSSMTQNSSSSSSSSSAAGTAGGFMPLI